MYLRVEGDCSLNFTTLKHQSLKLYFMLRNINWRYAFGEIIIVIIGISIAFALNNWAANTKEKRIKKS